MPPRDFSPQRPPPAAVGPARAVIQPKSSSAFCPVPFGVLSPLTGGSLWLYFPGLRGHLCAWSASRDEQRVVQATSKRVLSGQRRVRPACSSPSAPRPRGHRGSSHGAVSPVHVRAAGRGPGTSLPRGRQGSVCRWRLRGSPVGSVGSTLPRFPRATLRSQVLTARPTGCGRRPASRRAWPPVPSVLGPRRVWGGWHLH